MRLLSALLAAPAQEADPWASAAGEAPWAEPAKPAPALATWGQRAIAFVLDLLLVLGAILLAETLLVGLLGPTQTLVLVLGGAATFLYFLAFALRGGATPGKRAMRLRTVAQDGGRLSPTQAFLEALGKTALLTVVFAVIDVVGGLLFAGDRRQRLLQRAARTIVVFEAPPAPKRVVFVP